MKIITNSVYDRVKELGGSAYDANTVSEYFGKLANNQKISDAEKTAMAKNSFVTKIETEMKSFERGGWFAEISQELRSATEIQNQIAKLISPSNSKNQNSQLQSTANGGIINNSETVGDEVNGGLSNQGGEENGRLYNQGRMDGSLEEQSGINTRTKGQVEQIGTTVEEYVSGGKAKILSGGTGEVPRRILINYTENSSVTFTEGRADNTDGYKVYTAFANAGIKVIYCDGPIERTVNGVTVSRTEAFTAPDGTVYVSSESTLPPKQIFDHEKVHVADKTNNPVYAEYEAVLYDEVDYLSDTYLTIAEKINKNQFNNKYDIEDISSYPIFMREIAAYVNQFVLSDPEYAEQTFGGMFNDWNAVVEAVNKFNTDLGADFSESASFMPETDNAESGEVGFREPSDQEIYREPTAQENNEALFGKRKNAKQRHILDVAKKLDSDLTVVFVDPDNKKLSGRAGVFMPDTKTIYLSNDNSVVGMYCQLFKHEFVHRLESKQAYQSFKNYLFRNSSAFERYVRARLKQINGTEFDGTREEALKALSDYYISLVRNGDFIAEYKRSFTVEYAEREMVADFVGEVLFKGKKNYDDIAQSLADSEIGEVLKLEDTFAEFENLNETERGWFRKMIDAIKDFISSLKGIKQNKRLVEDLEYIEKRLTRVLDSKDSKKAAKQSGGAKYSLNVNAKSELHKALYDMSYRNEVLLRDETPSIMLSQKGVKNLPMVMKASHIRENVFTEEEAHNLGLKVDKHTHYHGIGEDYFLKIIDSLDNVKEAYRGTKNARDSLRRENYFLLVTEFKDENKNVINVPVFIDELAQCNRVFIETNKIATVFGRDNFREYINRQVREKNLVRIKNKSNKISEGDALIAPAYENTALNNKIPHKEDSVNNNLSEETENYSDISDIKQQFSLTTPAQQQRENLDKYERGEITREEYLEETDRLLGVANEMSVDNIKSGNYSSNWAEGIGTERINADVYNTISSNNAEQYNLQSSVNGDIINNNQNDLGGVTNDGQQNGDNNQRFWGTIHTSESQVGTVQENLGRNYDQSRTKGIQQRGSSEVRNQGNNRRVEPTPEQKESLKTTAIKDENGNPKVVHHFTDNMDFETFSKGDIGFHFGNEQQAIERGKNLKKAGRIIKAYLDIKNPLKIPTDLMTWSPIHIAFKLSVEEVITKEDFTKIGKLTEQGGGDYNSPAAVELRKILADLVYDGIIYENMFEADGESYIAFYPEQVIVIDDGKGNTQADPKGPANFMPETDNSKSGEVGFREPSDQEVYREPTAQENNEALFGKRKNAKQRHIIYVGSFVTYL